MGRPLLEIDEAEVARLAESGARNSEIAAILGVDDETVSKRFSRLLAKKRAERRIALRDAQYREALAGNATMLVWLGKNELDQTDKQVVEQKTVVVERRDRKPRQPASDAGAHPG